MLYFKIQSVTENWQIILDDFEATFDISQFIKVWDIIKPTKNFEVPERTIINIEWPLYFD